MSYADARIALNALAGKSAGDLIRADDWNNLIARISDLGDELNDAITALEGFVGEAGDAATEPTLAGRVRALEERDVVLLEDFEELRDRVEPLLDQYQLTLETGSVNFLLGQTGDITARVLDLDDEVPNPRPWVDFVCTWGRLQAVSGFTTRPGEDGKSASVRVNSDGIARVRVMSDANATLTESETIQVQQFFQTSVSDSGSTSQSVGSVIAGSSTSGDSGMQPVYQMISQRYGTSSGVNGLRRLTDTFYEGTLTRGDSFWNGGFVAGRWQDHRTTVMAFVKNDANPTTPDQSRAVSSIQLNFRDWVSPWIRDYFEIPLPERDVFIPRFEPRINPDDFRGSLFGFQEEIEDIIRGEGLIGRHRGFKLADEVLGVLGGGDVDPPRFMEDLRNTSRQAIAAQQSMDVVQVSTPAFVNERFAGGAAAPVMQAMIGQAAQSALASDGVAGVQTQMVQVQNDVGAVNDQVNDISGNVTSLNTRIAQTESRSQNIQTSLSDISTRVNEIPTLDESGVRNRLQEISATLGVIRTGVDNFPRRG